MTPIDLLLYALNFFGGQTTVNGPGGFHLQGSFLFVSSVLTFIVATYLISLIWVWQDAQRRGKNGFVTLLFILLTGWPASFIWWFWLRPPLAEPKSSFSGPTQAPTPDVRYPAKAMA